jgi:hypothetical protein
MSQNVVSNNQDSRIAGGRILSLLVVLLQIIYSGSASAQFDSEKCIGGIRSRTALKGLIREAERFENLSSYFDNFKGINCNYSGDIVLNKSSYRESLKLRKKLQKYYNYRGQCNDNYSICTSISNADDKKSFNYLLNLAKRQNELLENRTIANCNSRAVSRLSIIKSSKYLALLTKRINDIPDTYEVCEKAATPIPTNTPFPTSTSQVEASSTPVIPTSTPEPTNTPEPTSTPKPTNTIAVSRALDCGPLKLAPLVPYSGTSCKVLIDQKESIAEKGTWSMSGCSGFSVNSQTGQVAGKLIDGGCEASVNFTTDTYSVSDGLLVTSSKKWKSVVPIPSDKLAGPAIGGPTLFNGKYYLPGFAALYVYDLDGNFVKNETLESGLQFGGHNQLVGSSKMLVCTNQQGIQHTKDGINWTVIEQNASITARVFFNGKFILARDDGFMLYLNEDGAIESTVPTTERLPLPSITGFIKKDNLLYAYSSLSNNIFQSTDGINWSSVTDFTMNSNISNITISNDGYLYIQTTSNTLFRVTPQYNVTQINFGVHGSSVGSFAALGAELVVSLVSGSTYKIVYSSDRGATWQQEVLPNYFVGSRVSSNWIFPIGNTIIVNAVLGSIKMVNNNGARSWQLLNSPGDYYATTHSRLHIHPALWVLRTWGSGLYLSNNKGVSWNQVLFEGYGASLPRTHIYEAAFYRNELLVHPWLSGSIARFPLGSVVPGASYSIDDSLDAPSVTGYTNELVSDGDYFFFGTYYGIAGWSTSLNGTFQILSPGSGLPVVGSGNNTPSFAVLNDTVLISNPGGFVVTDKARSFSRKFDSINSNITYAGRGIITPSNTLIVPVRLSDNTSALWKSVDSGVSWTQIKPEWLTDSRWLNSSLVNGGIAYMENKNGLNKIYYSEDEGLTWSILGGSGLGMLSVPEKILLDSEMGRFIVSFNYGAYYLEHELTN